MTNGLVFDIQHFSVHDGPGIRTTVFLKGCPLRCEWCCNPESQAPNGELRRRASRCSRCLSCVASCPHGAAAGTADDGPSFEQDLCRSCAERSCAEVCPEGALVLCGKSMSVPELVEAVVADSSFFRNSGGGVTFSGGEPFLQGSFLVEALAALRSAGIPAAVETCGLADPAVLLAALPFLDLIYFDLKLADPEEHRLHTGLTNERILENLARVARAAPGKVVIRFPLVPGITDGPSNVARVAAIASSLGIERASVVPYHPMGTPKYAELGRGCPVAPPLPTAGDLERVFDAFEAAGISCELA